MEIPAFEELKRLVIRSKHSIALLGNRAGVNPNTITAWLDGRTRCPRIDTMLRVAHVIGQDIELTGNVKKMVSFYPTPKLRMTSDELHETLSRLQ